MPYKDKEKQRQFQHDHYVKNKEKFQQRLRNIRKRNKDYILDIKSQLCCQQCGENNSECLDFHHTNGDKINEVAILNHQCASINKIDEEIAKCDILCANCHRKLHNDSMTDGSQWKGVSKSRIQTRQWYIEYKKKQKCINCGENDPKCLSFHHIRDKQCNISSLKNSASLLRLQEEIAKCIVLCENCHRIEHNKENIE